MEILKNYLKIDFFFFYIYIYISLTPRNKGWCCGIDFSSFILFAWHLALKQLKTEINNASNITLMAILQLIFPQTNLLEGHTSGRNWSNTELTSFLSSPCVIDPAQIKKHSIKVKTNWERNAKGPFALSIVTTQLRVLPFNKISPTSSGCVPLKKKRAANGHDALLHVWKPLEVQDL